MISRLYLCPEKQKKTPGQKKRKKSQNSQFSGFPEVEISTANISFKGRVRPEHAYTCDSIVITITCYKVYNLFHLINDKSLNLHLKITFFMA